MGKRDKELTMVLQEIYKGMMASQKAGREHVLSPTALVFIIGLFKSYDNMTGILTEEFFEEKK